MIKPTIGRVVWFQPGKPENHPLRDQPFAAIVAYVWNDRTVNLAYFNENGEPRNATSVALLQDDDVKPEYGHFAEWMPYQVGQAKKHEADAPKVSERMEHDRIDALKLATGCIYRALYTSFDEYITELERFTRYLKTGETGVKS